MDYQKAVRVCMAKAGIRTQGELAERSGLHENTIYNLMKGRPDRIVHVTPIAKALGVEASELLREAEQYPDPEIKSKPDSEVAA